jgi:hypothetical protein
MTPAYGRDASLREVKVVTRTGALRGGPGCCGCLDGHRGSKPSGIEMILDYA